MKIAELIVPSLVIAAVFTIGCEKSRAEDPTNLPQVVVGPSSPTVPPVLTGTLTAGGTGCAAAAVAVPNVTETEIEIPVETLVDKDASSALKRGACGVALPLSIPAGYKMIVDDVELETDILLATGASADGSVEVFVAGSIGDTLDISAKSRTRPKRVRQILSFDPQFETACGASINLRSQSSVVLKDGAGVSSARLGFLKLKYRLEVCP